MYEILQRALPYYELRRNKDVMEFVIGGGRLSAPTVVPHPPELWSMAVQCFDELPSQRYVRITLQQ